MNDLKELLELSISDTPNEEKACNIVSKLMGNYVIMKGNDSYEIMEAEFYYYSKFHKDITVYERDMDSGRFFFHQSGVDITFKSHIERSEGKINSQESAFGGILIRSLKRNTENSPSGFILGPMNCVNHLWSDFNAIEPSLSEYPYLEYKAIERVSIKPEKRFYPVKEERKDNKLKLLNSKFDEEVSWAELNHFLNLEYRFVRTDIRPDASSLKKYSNRPIAWTQGLNTK